MSKSSAIFVCDVNRLTMKNNIIVATILIAIVITWLILPSDKEKIEAHFLDLINVVNQQEEMQPIARLQRIKDFQRLFTRTVHFYAIDLPLAETVTNEELTRFFFTLAERATKVTLSHAQLEFTMISENRAEVMTHFQGRAWLPDGKQYESENDVKVVLNKVEGDWLFSEFEAQHLSSQ